jgi:hypothetical protein
LDGVEDDALLSPELLAPLLDEGLELLDEGLDESLDEAGLEEELGEAVLPEDELSLGVLLMPPAPEGAPASDPAEVAPLVLAPDAPEELSPEDEVPALAPPALPLDAPPAPCAQAAVAKATMAAVTAALMSLRFIFSSSRVGMEMDCAAGDARTMP